MEEQRQRQQDESRRDPTSSDTPATSAPPSSHEGAYSDEPSFSKKYFLKKIPLIAMWFLVSSDEAMLERALAMSIEDSSTAGASGSSQQEPDFGAMTEDEQIAFALRMSMQDAVTARKFPLNYSLTLRNTTT